MIAQLVTRHHQAHYLRPVLVGPVAAPPPPLSSREPSRPWPPSTRFMAFPAAWEKLHLTHLPRPWRGVGLGAIPHPLPLCAPRLARLLLLLLLLLAVLGSEVDANAELLAVLGYGCSDSAFSFSAGAVAACCISISSQFGNRSGTTLRKKAQEIPGVKYPVGNTRCILIDSIQMSSIYSKNTPGIPNGVFNPGYFLSFLRSGVTPLGSSCVSSPSSSPPPRASTVLIVTTWPCWRWPVPEHADPRPSTGSPDCPSVWHGTATGTMPSAAA